MEKCKEMLEKIADFYEKEGRALPWRESRDPYPVWLSEIMLQQTRVEAVIPYFHRFLSLFPTVSHLASAPEDDVLKAWEGLGYYSRARNLQKAAKVITEKHGGAFPQTHEGLLSLPGVGSYTAAAIGSVCFGLPTAAVDGNVLRVYARVFADGREVTAEAVKKDIRDRLNAHFPSGDRAGSVTQGFMEVGQRFCSPNGTPRCEGCPLADICSAHAEGKETLYPKRAQKKARKKVEKTVLLLHTATENGGVFLIRKRDEGGLLGGLWEFPSVDKLLSPEDAMEHAKDMGLSPLAALPSVSGIHIFTHLEWHMRGVLIECAPAFPNGLVAASAKELREKYAIASAFSVFKDFIFKELL